MAAYDCEQYIQQAVTSILGQTYRDIELLVCDDASTDRTAEIIDSLDDDRIRLLSNDNNIGYLRTVNRLFTESSGDYITFQDADDWSSADRIQRQLDVMGDDIRVSSTGYSRVRPDNGDIIYTVKPPVHHEEILEQIEQQHHYDVCGGSIMIHRSVYESIGGYRAYFDRMGGEDIDWIYRVIEKFRMANISDPLYFYRFNPVSISGDVHSIEKGRIAMALAYHFHQQRMTGDRDDLEKADYAAIDLFVSELRKNRLSDENLYTMASNHLIMSGSTKGLFGLSARFVSRNLLSPSAWMRVLVVLGKVMLGRHYRPVADFIRDPLHPKSAGDSSH